MIHERVVVVTGANRGIGLEICRQMARRPEYCVVLTSRDEEKGLAAVQKLQKEELAVRFCVCDVDHASSVADLKVWLCDELGRCDVLINNAGIFPDLSPGDESQSWPGVLQTPLTTLEKAMRTNLYGASLMIQALVPMMVDQGYGRVVNLSSGMGQLSDMQAGCPAYRISKTALNALSRTLAQEVKSSGVLVNSMCPGWVRTEMGGPSAPRTVEQGAETAVWLATLPDDGPTGGFFRDRKPIPW